MPTATHARTAGLFAIFALVILAAAAPAQALHKGPLVQDCWSKSDVREYMLDVGLDYHFSHVQVADIGKNGHVRVTVDGVIPGQKKHQLFVYDFDACYYHTATLLRPLVG